MTKNARIMASLTSTALLACIAAAQDVEGLAPDGSRASTLPQIDRAAGPLVREIADGLYSVTDGVYVTMFLVYGPGEGEDGDGGVIAVDAPPTMGDLTEVIAGVTDRPITHVVYSHAHTDHIGGAAAYPKDAVRVAHAETARLLAEVGDPRRPVPAITFEGAMTLRAGDAVLELAHHGPNHTPGNIFIHAPDHGALMLVDVVFPGWMPFKNLGIVQDVRGYLDAFDAALAYDFDTFVGGHVAQVGTRADVETARDFAYDLRAQAAAALEALPVAEYAGQAGTRNPWRLYDGYQDAVTERCRAAIVERWSDRLSGTDVYAADNCWVMSEAISVDLAPTAP